MHKDGDTPTVRRPGALARTVLIAASAFVTGLLVSPLATTWMAPRTTTKHTAGVPWQRLQRSKVNSRVQPPVVAAPTAETALPAARYERSDVDGSYALLAFPAILAVLLLSVLLARWIYPGAVTDRRMPTAPPTVPAPRLQYDPAADMRTFLKIELARLNSGGWDDQARGEGHIPIDEAMRRIAASGIPDWPK